jgi:hypothetical protein
MKSCKIPALGFCRLQDFRVQRKKLLKSLNSLLEISEETQRFFDALVSAIAVLKAKPAWR